LATASDRELPASDRATTDARRTRTALRSERRLVVGVTDTEESKLPLTGAELGAGVKVGAALLRLLGRPEPESVLKRRAEVKAEIRSNLYAEDANWGEPPEIVVIKRGKHDAYPEVRTPLIGRGASDWFKSEVRELHDRGLALTTSIEHVIVEKGKARRVRFDDPDPRQQKVWLVGRIPYERIRYLDWEPDPAYGAPRFYVAYTRFRRKVFRDVVLYEGGFDGAYAYELHGVKYIGEGGGPIRRAKRLAKNVKFRHEIRRGEKSVRKGKHY
jgi:hypothetical protein